MPGAKGEHRYHGRNGRHRMRRLIRTWGSPTVCVNPHAAGLLVGKIRSLPLNEVALGCRQTIWGSMELPIRETLDQYVILIRRASAGIIEYPRVYSARCPGPGEQSPYSEL